MSGRTDGGLRIYPEMSEGMIAYVAGQIRTFFGRCVSGAFRPQLGRPGRHGGRGGSSGFFIESWTLNVER